MKNTIRVFIACTILFCACSSGNNTNVAAANNNAYTLPDEAAIKKAVDDAYAAITFINGDTLKFVNIKNAFIPQAQLINFIADTAQILSINDFVKAYTYYIKINNIKTFNEEEIYGRTDQFGNIAQRISTYKTFINNLDVVAERGVNSFQLIKTPQGWKVSSIIWDVEDSVLKIPNYYLGKK